MRKPYWRAQSESWVIKLPGGKLKTLGKDPHGATRKNPPPEIEKAWHEMDRVRKPKDMLLSDIADKYVDNLTNPKSKQSAREQLDWFMAFTGRKIKVSDLRVRDVTEYLKTKKWSESSKATAVNRITAALNWAVGEGYIEDHKVKFAKGKKPRFGTRETVLTPEQQKTLEDASYPALRLFLSAMRESGCRPGEICTVTIDKVDLKRRVMMVKNKTAVATGKKDRVVYLSPALVEVAREAMGERREGPVFLNSYGQPWKPRTIAHRVRKLRIKLGLPEGTVPYTLRATFATRGVENGVDIITLSELLGHTSVDMLKKHYVKLGKKHLHDAVDKITGDKTSVSE